MSTDLHNRLDEAVRRRLEVARAATSGPWRAGDWLADFGTSEAAVTAIEHAPAYGPFPQARRGDVTADLVLSVDNGFDEPLFAANVAHVVANDPDTVIRMCNKDLDMLERHYPERGSNRHEVCAWCRTAWPCPDIRGLATAYDLGDSP